MIAYPPSLAGVGGARTGLPPVNLLDVQDVNGNNYFWCDRGKSFSAPSVLTGEQQNYQGWLLSSGPFTFNRSMATDSGSFKLQNISGTTLARDVEVQLRASAIEGALFLYRCWQNDAQAAWLLTIGTLTFDDGDSDTATFKTRPLSNPAQEDTPLEEYCETCQIQWAGPRCGSTEETECLYSFQSCQVVERIMVALNDFEKNYGEATANSPLTVINRSRRI
jgi:hypothetical protein